MENIEKLVIAWLNSIDTEEEWEVSAEKPAQPPAQYILVDRTGGPRESWVLDQAEILIEVYHKTSRVTASDKANEIADRIRELLSYSDNITHADVNSVISLDDTVTQYRRYQIYCDIYLRR